MTATDATPEAILHKAGASFEVFDHPPIRTYEDIRNNLDLPAECLLKTMAFRTETGFALASLPILSKVAYGALAKHLGTSRSRLRPADTDDLAELRMEVGGVSPLTDMSDTTVVFDTAVTSMTQVYCGSGRADRTIAIAVDELIRVVNPAFAMIAVG